MSTYMNLPQFQQLQGPRNHAEIVRYLLLQRGFYKKNDAQSEVSDFSFLTQPSLEIARNMDQTKEGLYRLLTRAGFSRQMREISSKVSAQSDIRLLAWRTE